MASKEQRKENIRELSRHWPSSGEINKLIDLLTSADQHAIVAAILGVAMLEYDLEQLLRPRFRRNDDVTWGRLVSDNGPAASFSQKISLAHAFGIIDDGRRAQLIAIKTIRNAFAHSKKLIDFDHPLILKELSKIKISDRKVAKTYRQMHSLSPRFPKSAFIYLCLILSTHMSRKMAKKARAKSQRLRGRMENSFFGSILDQSLQNAPRFKSSNALKGILHFDSLQALPRISEKERK